LLIGQLSSSTALAGERRRLFVSGGRWRAMHGVFSTRPWAGTRAGWDSVPTGSGRRPNLLGCGLVRGGGSKTGSGRRPNLLEYDLYGLRLWLAAVVGFSIIARRQGPTPAASAASPSAKTPPWLCRADRAPGRRRADLSPESTARSSDRWNWRITNELLIRGLIEFAEDAAV